MAFENSQPSCTKYTYEEANAFSCHKLGVEENNLSSMIILHAGSV